MKLSGNTILITGGSTGIGLAFARKFKEMGNEIIITGRSQAKLDAAAADLPGISTIQCDAASVADITRMAAEIRDKHPKCNVLLNNAGIFLNKNLAAEGVDLESLTIEVDINVSGCIRTVAALIGQLKANRGTIINVSSGLAFVPLVSAPIYCATKAALHAYTLSLREQLNGTGVEVIELMPPAVKTELTADLPEGDITLITTDVLINDTIKALQAGKAEIRVGQANQLHWMSRIAPNFIRAQLAKASRSLIPDA